MKEERDGKKNVLLLGLSSLFNDIGSEIIMPILPLFLLSFGAGGLVIGIIGGLRDGLANLVKFIFGYLSDKTSKRKNFVVGGYFTSSISKLLLMASTAWSHVLIFTSLDRIGKGIRDAPRDVIVAESMAKHKSAGFGLHRSLDALGGVIGSILVIFLFWYFKFSFFTIILIAGIISIFSIIPLVMVKDLKTPYSFKKDDFKLHLCWATGLWKGHSS
ncbi:MAG: MFS transporter [Candidatus Pacearchaeota archaeon]|jgi:hypothetical protein